MPVVTLQGLCRERQAKNACKTVVTREDLDRFVSAVAPNVSESARGRLAMQYARTLAFSSLAERQGLEKDPVLAKELDVELKLVRMRILANALVRKLEAQSIAVGDPEIQKYYDEHRDRYQEIQVRRLSVPFEVPTESGRPLERPAVKAEMEALRTRAAAGEDFNRLQLDAYQHLRIQATPPVLNVLTLRRESLQGVEAEMFNLNPGDVSSVLDLPAALAIVKVVSKGSMPIASVRQEIEATLREEHLQAEIGKLTKQISAQFNLQYLDMSSQPDIFGQPGISPAANRVGARRTSSGRR